MLQQLMILRERPTSSRFSTCTSNVTVNNQFLHSAHYYKLLNSPIRTLSPFDIKVQRTKNNETVQDLKERTQDYKPITIHLLTILREIKKIK